MDKNEDKKEKPSSDNSPQIKVTEKKAPSKATSPKPEAKPTAAKTTTKATTEGTKKTTAKTSSTKQKEVAPTPVEPTPIPEPVVMQEPMQQAPAQTFGPSTTTGKPTYKASTMRKSGTIVMIAWFALVAIFSVYIIFLSNNTDFYNQVFASYQQDWMLTNDVSQSAWIYDNAGNGLGAEWLNYIFEDIETDAATIVIGFDNAGIDVINDNNELISSIPNASGGAAPDYAYNTMTGETWISTSEADVVPTGTGWLSMNSDNLNTYYNSALDKSSHYGLLAADSITQLLGVRGWFRTFFGIAMVVLFVLFLRPTTSPATTGMAGMIFLGWIGITLFFSLFNGRFGAVLVNSAVTLTGALLMFFGSQSEIKILQANMQQANPQQYPPQQYPQQQYPPQQQQYPQYQQQPMPMQQSAVVDQIKMKHVIQISKFRIETKVALIKSKDSSFNYNEVVIPTKIENVGHLNIILENIVVSENHVSKKANELGITFDDVTLTKEGMKKFNVNESVYTVNDFMRR